ncbi:MAG: hypothetical protein ACOCNB_09475, partial [Acetivibrio ethanolgignens]
YRTLGMYILGIYLLILMVYSGITVTISTVKYARAVRFEKKFGNVLGILHKLYEEAKLGQEELRK